jgi:hypothetical protein
MRQLMYLFVLFFPVFLFGQSIVVKGKCTDKRNKALLNVRVYSTDAPTTETLTDETGSYTLTLPQADSISLRFVIGEFMEERTLSAIGNKSISLDIRFPFIEEKAVKVQGSRTDPFEIPKLPYVDLQKLPMPSVERTLVYTTAATSNNELTTNYNVRGGSYDENLVYVNGFAIHRPFLTRSGQQEGMSFINTALVQNIRFSAGGFDSQYGDKLSSVLDIDYKTPDKFEASAMASLLGVEAHAAGNPTSRFNYLVGARYRSNGYLLNSLPAKGSYNPVFWDAQLLTNYAITEKLTWSLLGHFSSNDYRFAPETQETDFGTANEAYSFNVYFEGQEQSRFQTLMGATALKWNASKRTQLDFYASVFNTNEREYFDIQGQYYINELETDPSQEEYGDSIAVLGVGTFLNHARNQLNATILSVYHNGKHILKTGYKDENRQRFRNHTLLWGANFQQDDFIDVLSEWKMIDSAGYSIPQGNDNEIKLFETIKSDLSLQARRLSGYAQFNSIWSTTKRDLPIRLVKKKKVNGVKTSREYMDTIRESNARWALNVGTRGGYTSVNKEFYVTPRVSLSYYPRVYMVQNDRIKRRDMVIRLASGFYYQPPFYREFRTFDGQLNLDVRAQKSLHVVGGTDVFFNMWNREVPFKFTAEAYYKYMWDINPYEIDNVRTRYYANNDAVAYAYGLDLNLNGQFVEGIESFFKVGLMNTREDVQGDSYKIYYNAAGERIIFGYSEDQVVADSATILPGYIPRPTDQWITVGVLIQDRMPKFESFTVQMGLQYGSRLPYGPPDFERYKDTLRLKSYFRVDIGMSYDLLNQMKLKHKTNFWTTRFTDAVISFEVFNLLGINNVLSKQWIQDVEGKYYSIPNYLTQRRFNLKLIVRF